MSVTIGELRSKLDELEKEWIDKDYPEFFGPFDDQHLITDHWTDDGYQGLGPVKITPYWELGLLIGPDEFKGSGKKLK